MKKRYIVREDQFGGRDLKKFKNEQEAIAFIGDNKNLYQYGSLTLLRYDQDGAVHVWDEAHQHWQEYTENRGVN